MVKTFASAVSRILAYWFIENDAHFMLTPDNLNPNLAERFFKLKSKCIWLLLQSQKKVII